MASRSAVSWVSIFIASIDSSGSPLLTFCPTLTATVTTKTGSPTGTVAFQDGGTILDGCGSVALTNDIATCLTATLTAGSHTLKATYSGDATFAASNGTATQTVTADIPTLSEWAMLLLSLLLCGIAWQHRQRLG